MPIEVQRKLAFPGDFGGSKAVEKSNTRKKDVAEFEVITPEQWAQIIIMDEPFAEIEKFKIKPVTLKVSIDKATYEELGYISKKLDLGLSEQSLIKIAIEDFVAKYRDMFVMREPEAKVIGVGHSEERRTYVKVKLKGTVARAIGNPPKKDDAGSGLCLTFGVTRQKLVQMAVSEFVKDLKK